MTRSAVSSLTRPRVSSLRARETVPGCTFAARATSRSVTEVERTRAIMQARAAVVCSARPSALRSAPCRTSATSRQSASRTRNCAGTSSTPPPTERRGRRARRSARTCRRSSGRSAATGTRSSATACSSTASRSCAGSTSRRRSTATTEAPSGLSRAESKGCLRTTTPSCSSSSSRTATTRARRPRSPTRARSSGTRRAPTTRSSRGCASTSPTSRSSSSATSSRSRSASSGGSRRSASATARCSTSPAPASPPREPTRERLEDRPGLRSRRRPRADPGRAHRVRGDEGERPRGRDRRPRAQAAVRALPRRGRRGPRARRRPGALRRQGARGAGVDARDRVEQRRRRRRSLGAAARALLRARARRARLRDRVHARPAALARHARPDRRLTRAPLRAQPCATHVCMRSRTLDRRAMAVLSLGHLCVDLCQGALPALLPFLIAAHHWSYGQASALVLAATVSSSIVQPLFGHLSDGRSLPWLLPGGIALAAAGIALAGVAGSYGLTFAVVVVSGLGVAAYHPEASRFANYVAGEKRATAMSFFSVGGNAGFALGPVLVTPLALAFGLGGTPLVAVIPAAVALLVGRELGRLKGFRPAPAAAGAPAGGDAAPDQWRPFGLLSAAVAARSVVYFGLMTLVPLYFVNELHASEATANAALTVMLAAGAVGTLVGGRLAGPFGRRVVLRTAVAGLTPPIRVMLLGGVGVAIGALALIGAATIATFSVTVVMGQEYLPSRLGIASGVTLGLAIGFGGLGSAALGVVADATSLRTALEVVALLPLPALALAIALPEGREHLRGRMRPASATARASLTAR